MHIVISTLVGAELELHQTGEIDIIEGVHDNVHNQVTWHTLPGCVLEDTGNFTGTLVVSIDHPGQRGLWLSCM